MIVPRPWQPGQVSSSPLVQEPDGGCWTQRSIHWPVLGSYSFGPMVEADMSEVINSRWLGRSWSVELLLLQSMCCAKVVRHVGLRISVSG